MSRTRARTTIAVLALTALLVPTAPASAATDTFSAAASSAGVSVSLAGDGVLEVGATGASISPGRADAAAVPAALAGMALGERGAVSVGEAVADPTEAADRCAIAVPDPLAPLVAAGGLCGDAYAEGDGPLAAAAAGVAELRVLELDDGDLAPITELLAELPLDELLDGVEAELDGYLVGAFDDVRRACLSEIEELNALGLLDDVLAALAEATAEDVAGILDDLDGLLGVLVPETCEALGDVADLILGGALLEAVTTGQLLDALATAEGVLAVTLLETESIAVSDGDQVVATAGPAEGGTIRITVDIPLLDELLGDLLADAVSPAIAELTAVLAPVSGGLEPVPTVDDLVDTLLDGDLLGSLLDGPLLEIGVAPGASSVSGDVATGQTSGDASPALVRLGGSLFALPVLEELDEALDAAARELDGSLLEALRGSALADVVWVQLLPASVDDAEVDGLPGTEASSGTATVRLLGLLTEDAAGPLLGVEVAAALAAVGLGVDDGDGDGTVPAPGDGGDPIVPPDQTPPTPLAPAASRPPSEDLPATGGGAALLGLAALGAATALRRRG